MTNSLKISFKRMLNRKTTFIFLTLFLIVFTLDAFVLLGTIAKTPDGYQFPHALEVFIMKHDSMGSLLPIFLPFFIVGISGDYLLNDKLSGLDDLSSIRSSRSTYLKNTLLSTSIVIAVFVAVVYIFFLLIFIILYPLSGHSFIENTLINDSYFLNPISPVMYALLLILANALAAVGFNLTAQAIGKLANKKPTFYIGLFLVIFIIPYILYFGIGPRILPFSRYMPFFVLNETLTLPISLLTIIGYWIGHILLNLLFIYIIHTVQQRLLYKGVLS